VRLWEVRYRLRSGPMFVRAAIAPLQTETGSAFAINA
jgi:hypothetical protein